MRKLPTDSANLDIFKWSQIVAQECRCPEDIIVGEEGNRSANFFKPLDHLKALVGFVGPEDLDMRETKLIADLSNMADTPLRSDYDHGSRMTCIDGNEATAEVIAVGQSWDDHSNILVGVAGCAWKRDWLEGPRGENIDDQA